ncbi:hypothetical protein ACWDWO_06950 [Actinopolymorpha singaporensis]
MVEALRGDRWVARERRLLPLSGEANLRLMDRVQLSSKARRYIS